MYAIFLNTLYSVGLKKLAVHIADYWGNHTSSHLKSRDYAALELALKQTVYPICLYCHWPVLPNRPHALCEHELTHYWCDNCCEEFPINERAKHEDSCKDHEAEWEAFVPEEEARLADEARWLKEENTAMEAYYAEQEAERQREIAEAEEASWPEDDEPEFHEETGDECSICGSPRPGIDCGCEEGDPLAGDVDPVGGYPEEVMLVPSPNGGFEEIIYDPTDPSQHPLAGYYEDDEDE
jgi:hypothetical protein